jgi:uncharacterized protein YaeQ
MALGATMRRFEIEVADADRAVYERIELRAAQHPSESDRYLVTRVIARVLENADGVDFSDSGVASGDEPAIVRRDLRGDLIAWIEVGSPSAERLHRAAKRGSRLAIYGWRGPTLAREIADGRVHRAAAIELFDLDAAFLDAIAATLERANEWGLSVAGGTLYLTCNGAMLEGELRRVAIPA